MSWTPSAGDDILVLQQNLARVQALLEASRQVHSTIRLEEVLAMTLEIAVKELEAEGAFFRSTNARFGSRPDHLRGSVPHDWTQHMDRMWFTSKPRRRSGRKCSPSFQ